MGAVAICNGFFFCWGRAPPPLVADSYISLSVGAEGVNANPLLTPAHKLFGEKFNQKPTAQTSAPCAELAIGNFCSAKVIFIGGLCPPCPPAGGDRREVGLSRKAATTNIKILPLQRKRQKALRNKCDGTNLMGASTNPVPP